MPNVAGVEVTTASEVASLVERQLQGLGGWSDRSDYTPVDGLVRAIRGSGSLAPAFARALVDLLEHGEATVRAGAAIALTEVTEHVSADEIVRVLEVNPRHFRGVAPPGVPAAGVPAAGVPAAGVPAAGEDIESRLLVVVAKAVRDSAGHACRFLQEFLLRHPRSGASVSVLLGLARTDPDWVAANARDLVPREAIGGVLRAVPGRAQRLAVVSALAPWPTDEGDALLRSKAWTLLRLDDDEKAELAVLISGETEQP
jgi:hypothetical protein